MAQATQTQTLLVTGASGHLGRRVIELLLDAPLEAGAEKIIAATRTPEKLADLRERGVEVRHADFSQPESLVQAFTGVDRLLLISTDAMGEPGLRIRQHRNAVGAAEKAGVRHVVYTSVTNPEPGSPVFVAPDHYATEQALEESATLSFTILRNNLYSEMLIGTLAQAIQMDGKLFSAAGEGKIGYVSREDCARAAASALRSSFDERRILDITGPEALSQANLAAIASELTGKPITYVPLQTEVLIQNMEAAGLPRPLAEGFASFDIGTAAGSFDVVSNAVEALTGHKPTSVRDFLAAHREQLMQAPQAPAAAH